MAIMQVPRAFYGRFDQSSVFVFKGHVRYLAVQALRPFIDEVLEHVPHDTLVIDLRELEAIDSTGMGLLARLGRSTLQRGRRSVIVCSVHDVITCLRSAAFDRLFIITEQWPFDEEPRVSEIPVESGNVQPAVMGRFILDAHRDLAALSSENQETFAGVIATLEAELKREGIATS